MSVNSISPALIKRLNENQGTQDIATTQNQVKPQVTQDTVEISTAPKKELSKGAKIGLVFGAIATAAGVAFLALRGKTGAKESVEVANKTIKVTDEFAEQTTKAANKLTAEVEKLSTTVLEETGKIKTKAQSVINDVLAKITKVDADKGGKKVVTEYTEDGTTKIRESVLKNNTLTIQDFVQKTKIKAKAKIDDAGKMSVKLLEYAEGCEKQTDGGSKWAKHLVLDSRTGKPAWYEEGFEKSAEGCEKWAKSLIFDFKTSKPSWYKEGCEISACGGEKYAKYLHIDPEIGKPSQYNEGFEKLAGGGRKLSKSLHFDPKTGKPSSYKEGFEISVDGEKFANGFKFNPETGKWVEMELNT